MEFSMKNQQWKFELLLAYFANRNERLYFIHLLKWNNLSVLDLWSEKNQLRVFHMNHSISHHQLIAFYPMVQNMDSELQFSEELASWFRFLNILLIRYFSRLCQGGLTYSTIPMIIAEDNFNSNFNGEVEMAINSSLVICFWSLSYPT